ncbi:hypothetical protein Q6A58_37455, partial [Pseudomonas aeruginosa]|uniref:hypothetical protein n=1 Tax=Pseudomonas aeruginosa TaxID=287 RepID=UPI00271252EC
NSMTHTKLCSSSAFFNVFIASVYLTDPVLQIAMEENVDCGKLLRRRHATVDKAIPDKNIADHQYVIRDTE